MNDSTTAELNRLYYTVGSPLHALLLGGSLKNPRSPIIQHRDGIHDGNAMRFTMAPLTSKVPNVGHSNRCRLEGLFEFSKSRVTFVLLLAAAENS